MSSKINQTYNLNRSGTSQVERLLEALKTDFVQIDERSILDLLRFAQQYGRELVFFDEQNQASGTWEGFLGGQNEQQLLEEATAFLQDPENYVLSQAGKTFLNRPHFVLLLVFLKLFQTHPQASLNTYTQRHLDYYYRELLGFESKSAEPDQVHVLIELAKTYTQNRLLLPADTALNGGKDSANRLRTYQTLSELSVNRAQIDQIKTVFVNRTVETVSSYDFTPNFPFTLPYSAPALQLVLGESGSGAMRPGGDLPYMDFLGYTVVAGPPSSPTENQLPSEAFVENELLPFLDFPPRELRLNLADFRRLIHLKQNRDADLNEWTVINTALGIMANDHGNSLTINPTNVRSFSTNFQTATGRDPLDSVVFSSLSNVNNVYDLYVELVAVLSILAQPSPPNLVFNENRRDDFFAFILTEFYNQAGPFTFPIDLNFSSPAADRLNSFLQMMRLRVAIIEEWQQILEIVNQAHRNLNSTTTDLQLDLEAPDFEGLLTEAYITPNPALTTLADLFARAYSGASLSSIDAFYQNFLQIEEYFALRAEEIQRVFATSSPLSTIHTLLEKAHQQKYRVKERQAYRALRTGDLSRIDRLGIDTSYLQNIDSNIGGFEGMLAYALGGEDLPNLPILAPPAGYALSDLNTFYQNEIEPNANEDVSESNRIYINQTLALELDDFRYIMGVNIDQDATPNLAPIWQWEKVYRLIDQASQQKRGILAAPMPSLTSLDGVHAAADASSISSDTADEPYPRWKTFGRSDMPEARLGILLSSSLLQLSAGSRTITLAITLDSGQLTTELSTQLDFLIAQQSQPNAVPLFSVELTGEEEWLTVPATLSYDLPSAVLTVGISLGPEDDPIVGLPADHPDYVGPQPMLKLVLADLTQYALLSQLILAEIQLDVSVLGLQPSLMRNDRVPLKAGEAFEPFGSSPRPGGRFSFVHPEIIQKELTRMRLEFDWTGLPDFASTYRNYSNSDDGTSVLNRTNRANFVAFLRLFDQGTLSTYGPATEQAHVILPATGTEGTVPLNLEFGQQLSGPSYAPLIDASITENVLGSDRYFRLELGSLDFGHAEYPGLASQQANELAIAIAAYNAAPTTVTLPVATDYEVNPPFTPEVQSLRISYEVSEQGIGTNAFEGETQLFHLHPFGYQTDLPENSPLLPRYDQEGELFIGLSNFAPPIDLSILFQLAEGSANPDVAAPEINWSYLVGNQWMDLKAANGILADNTQGLLNSGITKIQIPKEADTEHTLMPTGQYWLRLSAEQNSAGLSDTIGIHLNAVLAQLDPAEVAVDHFGTPLAPETIQQLLQRDPAIKQLVQPYSSFGGRPEEPAENFNTRVSERLRHKNRALNAWDYERLVLERFPQVYRVKSMPTGSEGIPGKVELIVIPNIRGLRPFDPFEPKLPLNILQDIETYLQTLAPPLAEIEVRNPVYLELFIRMSVAFFPRYQSDAQFYLSELNQGLLKLLAPWAYDEGAELVLGGRFFSSLVIDYVEQQPYVDYVKSFRLLYGEDGVYSIATEDELQNGLIAPRPDGIWVSAPGHELDLGEGETSGQGIGFMKVQIDLIVGPI